MRLVSEAILHNREPHVSARRARGGCTCITFMLAVALLAGAGAGTAHPQQESAPLDTAVHIEVETLREASAPMVVGDHLILSYDSERPIRYVAAVFEHDDFATRHLFKRNRHDVLFLAYRLPEDLDEIRYRVVIDGVWTTDPNNPDSRRLATDTNISYVDVTDRTRPTPEYPRRLDDGRVEFLFRDAPGRRVYVAGSFSNWDPYRHRMREVEPGIYRARLSIREGEHFYHFVSDGRRHTDPLNPGPSYRRDGGEVSRFDG